MVWTIKLTFAVLLTSLTGSIVLLVWHFIGKGLEWRSTLFTDTGPLKRLQYLLCCMVYRSWYFRELVFAAVGDAPKKISGQNHEVE